MKHLPIEKIIKKWDKIDNPTYELGPYEIEHFIIDHFSPVIHEVKRLQNEVQQLKYDIKFLTELKEQK